MVKNPLATPQQIINETLTLSILDSKFLSKLTKIVPVEFFRSFSIRSNSVCYHVAKICYDYFEKTKEAPVNYFQTLFDEMLSKMKEDLREPFKQYFLDLAHLQKQVEFFNQTFLLMEMLKRGKLLKLNKAVQEAGQASDKGDDEHALTTLEEVVRDVGSHSNITDDVCNLFKDRIVFSKEIESTKRVVQFGLTTIDSHIPGGVQRGELLCVMATTGGGKSWFLTHLGDVALFNGLKVLHITCEISMEEQQKRYIRAFNYLTKYEEIRNVRFPIYSPEGEKLEDILIPCNTIWDENAVLQGISSISKYGGDIKIKQFSSGTATIRDIEALLTFYETENWKPDLLIVDYPECMYLNPRVPKRDAISQLYLDLRRIAGQNQLACVTASQVNRSNMNRALRSPSAVSEDIQKAFHSDMIVSVYEVGHIREFWVIKNRKDEGRFGCQFSSVLDAGQMVYDDWPIPREEQREDQIVPGTDEIAT